MKSNILQVARLIAVVSFPSTRREFTRSSPCLDLPAYLGERRVTPVDESTTRTAGNCRRSAQDANDVHRDLFSQLLGASIPTYTMYVTGYYMHQEERRGR